MDAKKQPTAENRCECCKNKVTQCTCTNCYKPYDKWIHVQALAAP